MVGKHKIVNVLWLSIRLTCNIYAAVTNFKSWEETDQNINCVVDVINKILTYLHGRCFSIVHALILSNWVITLKMENKLLMWMWKKVKPSYIGGGNIKYYKSCRKLWDGSSKYKT